ncbi:MAG: hypothetical protein CMJ83_04580 [Planctomycetes bacterium]|nr:hypothetical protein [Planctomycetota bacterium]
MEGGRGSHILLVEDEPVVQDLVATVLEEQGHTVRRCATARQVEAAIGDGFYDALVCDRTIPGLDGISLHRRLAQEGNPLAGRMVLVTGDPFEETLERFLKATRLPVLKKPFDLDALRETVAAVLQHPVPSVGRG